MSRCSDKEERDTLAGAPFFFMPGAGGTSAPTGVFDQKADRSETKSGPIAPRPVMLS